MIKPCVVIPIYNHEHVINSMVQNILNYDLTCILVNDGSSTSCTAKLNNLAKASPDKITILHHAKNSGKGSALITGFNYAEKMGYSHALQIDADGQHNTNDIPKFLTLATKNPEAIIVGCPQYDDSVPKSRLYGRYLTHIWVWINTLSFDIKDSMCGFRVYPLAPFIAINKKINLGKRMEFDSEILVRLHWAGSKIINVPTRVTYPKDGISHFRLLKDNALISRMHAQLFFGMLWRLPQRPKKHWANINEITFVTGMRFLFGIYKLFGRIPFRITLYPVVFFYYLTQSRGRKASQKYLQHVKSSHSSLRHFMVFGESLLDKLLLWGNLLPLDNIRYVGEKKVVENLSQKIGGLFICAHLGNLELCRVFSKYTPGLKLTVLMHTKHAQAFNQLLAQLNPDSQLNVIQVTEISPSTIMMLSEKIQQGEYVVIAGDRIPVSPNPRTVSVPFLGENASFPVGPYIMAHLLQCPVFLIFSTQSDITIEAFRERIQLPHKNRQEALTQLATDYAARLAYYCEKNPLQWFNFYDFWDTSP